MESDTSHVLPNAANLPVTDVQRISESKVRDMAKAIRNNLARIDQESLVKEEL